MANRPTRISEYYLMVTRKKKTLILSIRMKHLKFLASIKRKVGLENLLLTRHIEARRDRGKQCITYVTILSKWLPEQCLGVTKNSLISKSYKGEGICERHDHICPDKANRKIIKKRSLMNDISNNNLNYDEKVAKKNNA